MKKVIMAVLSILTILIFILILYTLHGRNYRQTEIDNALTSSMENAMQVLLTEDKPKTQEEWEEMFVQSMAMQIESESELTVNIGRDSNMDKGILTAEAILRFHHPIGTEGTVSTGIRTIILEEYLEE